MRAPAVPLGLLALLTGASAARADEIHLNDGGILVGRVEERGNEVLISRDGNTMRIPREMVVRIVYGPLPEDLYAEKRSELAGGNLQEHLDLARWCVRQRLKEQAREQYGEVLELDPDNAEARQALGYVRLEDGRWVAEEEAAASAGLVKHRGKWTTPAERDAAVAEQAEAERAREAARKVRRALNDLSGRDKERSAAAAETLRGIDWKDKLEIFVGELGTAVTAVRRYLCAELAGCGAPDRAIPGLVRAWLYDRDPEVRAAARASVAALQAPEIALSPILRGLFSDRGQVRLRALYALIDSPHEEAAPILVALWEHNLTELELGFSQNPGAKAELFRRTHALPDGTRAAFPRRLVSRHPMEDFQEQLIERERAAVEEENAEILRALRRVAGSGPDGGSTPEAWRAWLKARKRGEPDPE